MMSAASVGAAMNESPIQMTLPIAWMRSEEFDASFRRGLNGVLYCKQTGDCWVPVESGWWGITFVPSDWRERLKREP